VLIYIYVAPHALLSPSTLRLAPRAGSHNALNPHTPVILHPGRWGLRYGVFLLCFPLGPLLLLSLPFLRFIGGLKQRSHLGQSDSSCLRCSPLCLPFSSLPRRFLILFLYRSQEAANSWREGKREQETRQVQLIEMKVYVGRHLT